MSIQDVDLERHLYAGLQLGSWLETYSEVGRWILSKNQPGRK